MKQSWPYRFELSSISSKIPKCLEILFSPYRTHSPIWASLIGIFYAMALVACFYFLILEELEFSTKTTTILTTFLACTLGFGCMISSQLRCVTLLSFPSMCGRGGRSTLKAFLIAYLLAGPVANLTKNGKEIVRSFACTTELAYKINKQKYDLIYQPFLGALMNIKGDMNEVKDTMDSIDDVIAPITNEFLSDEEVDFLKEQNDYIDDIQNDTRRSADIEKKYYLITKRIKHMNVSDVSGDDIEEEYYRKLEYRCENILTAAAVNCRKIFAKSYDDCAEKVTWVAVWILCWPMKLNFVCNLVSVFGGDDVCDPSQEMPKGWGEGYKFLILSRDQLASDFQGGTIKYNIKAPTAKLNLRTAEDAAHTVMKEFEQKKNFIDFIILFTKRILALVFIKIILNANEYHSKYLSEIEFDNNYITRYFKKIDARRYKTDQHTLLPLKKIEKPNFIDPLKWKMSKKETSHMTVQAVKAFVEFLTATTIVLIDRLCYETLDLVRRHSKIEYYQSGSHDLIVTVKGTGMIANVVRNVVKGFNFRTRINETHSNSECLPDSSPLDPRLLQRIYVMCFILFLMVMFEGYAQRLRWLICALFYPKREKQRVLFLYNETLKKRKEFFRYMTIKVKRMVKENKLKQDISLPLMLRLKYPNLFGWMIKFNSGKRKCLICGEPEPSSFKDKQFIHECPACLYIYCIECWNDISKNCFACNPRNESDEDSVGQGSDEDGLID